MQKIVVANEMRTSIVCIDDYKDRKLKGRIYNPFFDGEIHFESLMEFILKMDSLLDEMNFPQSFFEKRQFSKVKSGKISSVEILRENNGAVATFHIAVLFRQNSSWQGTVTWMESGREECFRSALELLFLIDSAVSENA